MVDGDLGLSGGDLRAAERHFQLLYQVAGRAGRAQRPGRVLIQTHLPEHPVMQALAAGDKERFYAEELAERRHGGMPPFGRLAALIVSGRDPQEVRGVRRPRWRATRRTGRGCACSGRRRRRSPCCAAATASGCWRSPAPRSISPAVLRPWLKGRRLPGSLRLHIDVDPYSFL